MWTWVAAEDLTAFWQLKPGGRLAISDILAETPLPDDIAHDIELLCACLAGAATIGDTKQMLAQAGFQDIRINSHALSQEIFREWGNNKIKKIVGNLVSAYVEAFKP